jgi:hypothetical protein
MRPDYLTATREVWALESRFENRAWVVEDFFSEADLAEEQRVFMAAKFPNLEFRLWRYLPEVG